MTAKEHLYSSTGSLEADYVLPETPATPETPTTHITPLNTSVQASIETALVSKAPLTTPANVSFLFATLGVICLIAALSVNDISGYSFTVTYETTIYCRWNEYTYHHSYEPLSLSMTTSVEYKYCCDLGVDGCCDVEKSGLVFVIAGIYAIVVSSLTIIANLFLKKREKLQKFLPWIFLSCLMFILTAIFVWQFITNAGYEQFGCFDTSDEGFYVGVSFGLYIGSAVFYCVAVFIAFKTKICDYLLF